MKDFCSPCHKVVEWDEHRFEGILVAYLCPQCGVEWPFMDDDCDMMAGDDESGPEYKPRVRDGRRQ